MTPVDRRGNVGTAGPTGSFRFDWNLSPTLLAPDHNVDVQFLPRFSWAAVEAARDYRLEISTQPDFSTSLNAYITDQTDYTPEKNLANDQDYFWNALSYTQPSWSNVIVDGDYFWRLRGVDGQGNLTPWSDLRSFRPTCRTSPNHIYPHYYYVPDTDNLLVHGDRSIAWPVFVWDTAFVCDPVTGAVQPPDYYELTVDDDVAFGSPNFQVRTLGHGAAPTQDNPFTGLTPGGIYHWRARAYLNGEQIGADSPWVMRYDPTAQELILPEPPPTEPAPIYPANGFEAVEAPPVLGWLPVTGTTGYRVQVARDAAFSEVVDEAVARFVNYVPWQGQESALTASRAPTARRSASIRSMGPRCCWPRRRGAAPRRFPSSNGRPLTALLTIESRSRTMHCSRPPQVALAEALNSLYTRLNDYTNRMNSSTVSPALRIWSRNYPGARHTGPRLASTTTPFSGPGARWRSAPS